MTKNILIYFKWETASAYRYEPVEPSPAPNGGWKNVTDSEGGVFIFFPEELKESEGWFWASNGPGPDDYAKISFDPAAARLAAA